MKRQNSNGKLEKAFFSLCLALTPREFIEKYITQKNPEIVDYLVSEFINSEDYVSYNIEVINYITEFEKNPDLLEKWNSLKNSSLNTEKNF